MAVRGGKITAIHTVIAVGVTLAAVVGLAGPAAAGVDDYPWRDPIRYPGSRPDPWGYYYRQCTSFVAWRLHSRNGYEMPRAIGNANNWDNWFRAHGVKVNGAPAVGAIAQTDAGRAGHVAWVEAVNSNGTVTVEEYNYARPLAYSERTVASGAFVYIHVRDQDKQPSTPNGLRVASAVEGSLTLRWLASTDDHGVAGYDILRGGQVVASVKATGFTDTTVAADVAYAYGVRAFDAVGNRSGVATITRRVLPRGQGGRAWVDFDGDGRADYCRVVGNPGDGHASCTHSAGTGFGATITSPALDWGYEDGRAWVDVNGDRRADYCRRVNAGNQLQCTLSTGTGFGATITSDALDAGYPTGRAWADFDGDGRADYCRRGGNTNHVDSYVLCTRSAGTGFGATYQSPTLDWGYEDGRAWVDVNGDRRADYCRRVNAGNQLQCTLSTGTGFGATITSDALDVGYVTGRDYVDFDGDHKADYCRVVGNPGPDEHVGCTLATTKGFGYYVSPPLDWGYET